MLEDTNSLDGAHINFKADSNQIYYDIITGKTPTLKTTFLFSSKHKIVIETCISFQDSDWNLYLISDIKSYLLSKIRLLHSWTSQYQIIFNLHFGCAVWQKN